MPSVDLRQISHAFAGHRVLDGLDLTIQPGQYTVLLGKSGCGKTTLLRVIAGLQPPFAGEVWIDQQESTAIAPRGRNVAMVFQNDAHYPHMSVAQSLNFATRSLPKSKHLTSRDSIERAVELTRIGHLLDRYPDRLSGGELRRVAIAKAVAMNRSVLLLDEPLAALDTLSSSELEHDLKHLHQQLGLTVAHVTHDGDEAMRVADRIAVLDRGKVVQHDAPARVYDFPASLQAAASLSTLPLNVIAASVQDNTMVPQDDRFTIHGGMPDWQARVQAADGKQITVAMRPEHVRVVTARETSSEPRLSIRAGECREQKVGDRTLWTSTSSPAIRALTSDIAVATTVNQGPDLASDVCFEVELRHLHFFDEHDVAIGTACSNH